VIAEVWPLLTTVVPAAALGGLGWALAREDRARETGRRRDAREQAATLAATALQRTLAELEDQLSSFSGAQSFPSGSRRDDLAIVAYHRDGTSARAGLALPFYPQPRHGIDPRARALDRADALEFRQQDQAVAVLAVVAHSVDPATRGAALLRIGRIERRRGHLAAALGAFEQLAALDNTVIEGLPAGLLGIQARALALEGAGRRDEVRRDRLCSRRRPRSGSLAALAGRVRVCEGSGDQLGRRADHGGDCDPRS